MIEVEDHSEKISTRLLDRFEEIYQKVQENKPESIEAERRKIMKEGKESIYKCKLMGLISSPTDGNLFRNG